MKVNKVNINSLVSNQENPRLIKEFKFKKLVDSIKGFPEMLKIRPIVINEDNVILGGNMRYKASIEAGLKEVYVIKADNLTPQQQREFIIKDNVGFGEWDWDILANDWDSKQLSDWGLEVWQPNVNEDLEDFFQETESDEAPSMNKIVLEYDDATYEAIKEKIDKDGRVAEVIFRTALDL